MAMDEPTYEFDVVNLRTTRMTTFRTVVNAIERQIKKVLQEKESEMDLEIHLFSIGKTSAHVNATADFLDPLDEDTVNKKHIGNRWREHRETEYGKDGMVVVAIITDDVADTLDYDDAEDCALDSEEELQKRFSSDKRLIHEEYHQGARVKNPADGYPLYITYAFAERLPQFTLSTHQGITSNYREESSSLIPFFPRQRETYQHEPRNFPPLPTRPYWPIQQYRWFPQTYYNRDWDEDSFFVPRRRPNSYHRYNPYR